MTNHYYTNWLSHNAETGGTNYNNVKQFADLDSAKKNFHELLSTYIAYGKLDHVSVILFDDSNNVIMRENWDGEVEVETTES